MTPLQTLEAQALADTTRWLERAVIGLNLCPFAKAVHVKGQVHCRVWLDDDADGLMQALLEEAQTLRELPAEQRDTTLLIAPLALADFLTFNDFTARAERRLRKAGHEGELQLASFHPQFQFAGTEAEDMGNASNQSPYPTLHLLREASIERAVAAVPEAADIYERNIRTLEALGAQGWRALDVGAHMTTTDRDAKARP
ncbi:DUF1415 domain-containing protein [Xenophilus arseniciresistens]|uniref:DUF1415 domain-containing protein n=1 Tax=Xenophilus arseniciresistens TaxID=1283306 RepID=A0AAE3N609_9BURK|nr:DUF1415 domain-containing protein [Xenophilus arseniciresistens]MDA7415523.1 DUF1415 domain-containing protein [Xenophilus arseniciresistens]